MNKTRKQRDWLTSLSIPEKEIGEYAIKHQTIPAGGKVLLNNLRSQLLGKQKGPNSLIYDVDTHWHALTGPTGTWMTDLPIEQRQMEECLKGMKGRVLVGGLGLGLAVSLLAKKKQVKEIWVAEISTEVISLVWPYVQDPNGKILLKGIDLFMFLEHCPTNRFDYAFYDIWQSDSEDTFFHTVCPLIAASKGKIKHPPINWQEDVMRGQLFSSLQNRLMFLSPDAQEKLPQAAKMIKEHPPWEMGENIWTQWYVPYFQWWKKAKPDNDRAMSIAQTYAQLYGLWNWKEDWKILSESQI